MSSEMAQTGDETWTVTYSNTNVAQSNTSFYYDEQVVYLLSNFGGPLVNGTLASIQALRWYETACTINFAAQAGACGCMFFVVFILSQKVKRRTPIFILNLMSLVFGFLRGLFLALYFLTAWVDIYPVLSGDYSGVPTKAYVMSILGVIMPILMHITVNLSLVLQARAVTQNIRKRYRNTIVATSLLVFFLATGFQIAEGIINCIVIIRTEPYTLEWVQCGALYTETLSIWWFSIIFTSKLVYTLYHRRKNGWKQWSGVKILAAMGGCTMIIPSIFAILEYVNDSISNSFPEAGTLTLTITALLLPLSSLWAGMAIHEESSKLDLARLNTCSMPLKNDSLNSSLNSGSIPSTYARCAHCMNRMAKPYGQGIDSGHRRKTDTFYETTTYNEVNAHNKPVSDYEDMPLDLEKSGVKVDRSYSLRINENSML